MAADVAHAGGEDAQGVGEADSEVEGDEAGGKVGGGWEEGVGIGRREVGGGSAGDGGCG